VKGYIRLTLPRARESQATAEQELLSSTSASVCELWSGKEIVRQLGQPDMKELVLINDQGSVKVFDLKGVVEAGYFVEKNGTASSEELGQLSMEAPNVALNINGSTSDKFDLCIWAGFGVVFQAIALVFPALVTYHWKFPKASSPVQQYAYPCFLAGACAVSIGTMLCSHVIEGITKEKTFTLAQSHKELRNHVHVFRLQKACKVSDQTFPPFIIYNSPGIHTIRKSRLEVTNSPVYRSVQFRSVREFVNHHLSVK
jgi:hypothetical protein